jgi:hydrogenase nickel incorporation protein HypB
MCVVCGCAGGEKANVQTAAFSYQKVQQRPVMQGHHHHAHSDTADSHTHIAVDEMSGDLHYGAGQAKVSVPGMSQERAIRIEQDVLGANNRIAADNRHHFTSHGIAAFNLVSSPGSGKTTLLCATIRALRQRAIHLPVAVIEGDQQTSHDADRIRETGAPAIQVNTGKGCHLDAQMVADAFDRLPLHTDAHTRGGVLFIENVGNLVCPAMWDLGEKAKVAILSVTEGEDKPLKYPDMFAAADLMIINKIDLLPYLQFDIDACIAFARRVNQGITVIQLSATTGEGMAQWLDWIDGHSNGHDKQNVAVSVDERIALIEAELRALKQQASNILRETVNG